jgi:glutamyl-tRNA reductase
MIGVIGASHRSADLACREAIAKALSACDLPLMDQSVPLLTCNRAEWYFSTQKPAQTHQKIVAHIQAQAGSESSCHLYTFFGLECFRHLGRVVAGLDSLFVGETEIQGQVKASYEEARKSKELSPELHFLFQRSLRTGKVLRSSVQLPSDNGLCEQVTKLIVDHVRAVNDPSVLLIGTSMINQRLARVLAERELRITYVNRTFDHAHHVAEEIGGAVVPWAELPTKWSFFPCVVAATRSSDFVIRPNGPLPTPLPQLLIDLGVPRNIDPALATENRRVVNLDAFTPSNEAEEVLYSRSWRDYGALAARAEYGR